VEFVAHAHHMLKDAALQEIWLNKEDDKKAWEKEFWRNKPTVLFAGLAELYKVWCDLSERGSHANITSICERFKSVEVDGQTEWRVNYTGIAEKPWTMGIMDMLITIFKMEETFFEEYEMRFQFDDQLLTMRAERDAYKGHVNSIIVNRYGIKPPVSLR
jgi:hypothetical protein